MSKQDPRYKARTEGEFAKAVTGVFGDIDFNQPPKEAVALYGAAIQQCEARGVPLERIRVLFWALGGSPDGWLWNGAKWRLARWGEPDWVIDKATLFLPTASSIWLALSKDEALDAGYSETEWKEKDGDERVNLFTEKTYGPHIFNIENIPAVPSMRALEDGVPGSEVRVSMGRRNWTSAARIFCQCCDFAFEIDQDSMYAVFRTLSGVSGSNTEEISIRLHELRLRWMFPGTIPSETNAALDYLRRWYRQPQRLGSSSVSHLACIKRPIAL